MHKSKLRGVSMNRQSANEKEKIDRHIVLDIDSEENYELFERLFHPESESGCWRC